MSDEENRTGEEDKNDTEKKGMDELMIELHNKTKEDVVQELYAFRRIWECMDEETQYLMSNISKMFSITQRNYNTKVGVLTKVFFEPKRFFIAVHERLYDVGSNGFVVETKEWSVLANMVLAYAVIHERDFED